MYSFKLPNGAEFKGREDEGDRQAEGLTMIELEPAVSRSDRLFRSCMSCGINVSPDWLLKVRMASQKTFSDIPLCDSCVAKLGVLIATRKSTSD
jgi:hypothetical protein